MELDDSRSTETNRHERWCGVNYEERLKQSKKFWSKFYLGDVIGLPLELNSAEIADKNKQCNEVTK